MKVSVFLALASAFVASAAPTTEAAAASTELSESGPVLDFPAMMQISILKSLASQRSAMSATSTARVWPTPLDIFEGERKYMEMLESSRKLFYTPLPTTTSTQDLVERGHTLTNVYQDHALYNTLMTRAREHEDCCCTTHSVCMFPDDA